MKSKYLAGVYLMLTLLVVACAGSSKYLPLEQIPAGNNEEIHVDKAYDFVYLNTYDAVNVLSSWVPDKTLKDEGLIRLQNTQFSRFDDSDNRTINLRVRRDSAKQTSVFLDPDSRRVIGADKVLEAVRKKLNVVPPAV